jgi:16S rRNA A1518/A1519 N6-dimethyltransferase RsmA/KsgA/DIM1 with predicted DNA glycosylase/AP lyase activity
LLENAGSVAAVEFDKELAENLRTNIACHSGPTLSSSGPVPGSDPVLLRGSNPESSVIPSEAEESSGSFDCAQDDIKLQIFNEDFLQFDLNTLPKNYKVVANVPYYITAKIVQKLLTADNKPSMVVLLVQKEVAERLAAKPGEMSILSISAQLFAEVNLGIEVPAKFFTPPPKVDSQVVIIKLRNKPLFENLDEKLFFRIVKAGFSARRKKLRTSLAGGLNLSKPDAENLLRKASIDPNLRAQDLSLENWYDLSKILNQA